MSLLKSNDRKGTPAVALVVGLGNPGSEFENTRHNAGADVIAILAQRRETKLKYEKQDQCLIAEVKFGIERVVLAFPQTYMNESGRVMNRLVKRSAISGWDQLIVVHDELDLPLGRLKISVGGGLAGHNGLASITQHLITRDYIRVRIGIGKPPGGKSRGADHVTGKMRQADAIELGVSVQRGADAVESIITDGVAYAMSQFNIKE